MLYPRGISTFPCFLRAEPVTVTMRWVSGFPLRTASATAYTVLTLCTTMPYAVERALYGISMPVITVMRFLAAPDGYLTGISVTLVSEMPESLMALVSSRMASGLLFSTAMTVYTGLRMY